eukprot:11962-Heterococcus_DN1.PRE.2
MSFAAHDLQVRLMMMIQVCLAPCGHWSARMLTDSTTSQHCSFADIVAISCESGSSEQESSTEEAGLRLSSTISCVNIHPSWRDTDGIMGLLKNAMLEDQTTHSITRACTVSLDAEHICKSDNARACECAVLERRSPYFILGGTISLHRDCVTLNSDSVKSIKVKRAANETEVTETFISFYDPQHAAKVRTRFGVTGIKTTKPAVILASYSTAATANATWLALISTLMSLWSLFTCLLMSVPCQMEVPFPDRIITRLVSAAEEVKVQAALTESMQTTYSLRPCLLTVRNTVLRASCTTLEGCQHSNFGICCSACPLYSKRQQEEAQFSDGDSPTVTEPRPLSPAMTSDSTAAAAGDDAAGAAASSGADAARDEV